MNYAAHIYFDLNDPKWKDLLEKGREKCLLDTSDSKEK